MNITYRTKRRLYRAGLIGGIILLVWMCQDSTEDNQWGPNPKNIIG